MLSTVRICLRHVTHLSPHLNRILTQGCVADISLDTSDGVEAEPSLFPLRASEGRLPIYEVPSKLAVMSEVSK